MKKLSDIICSALDHTAVFTPKKPLFEMDWLAYVIAEACKSGVVDVESGDGSFDTSSTREKINKGITWTKKSKKGFCSSYLGTEAF